MLTNHKGIRALISAPWFFWIIPGLFFFYLFTHTLPAHLSPKERYIDIVSSSYLSIRSNQPNLDNSYPREQGGAIDSAVDRALDTFWYGLLPTKQPLEFIVTTDRPTDAVKVVIESTGKDRVPVDFSIEAKTTKTNFEKIGHIRRNTASHIEVELPEKFQHDLRQIRMLIFRTPQRDGLVKINEISLYERLKVESEQTYRVDTPS